MAYMAIRFIFSGLIAFVPNSFLDPTIMTAYLVRSATHTPLLSLPNEDVVNCPAFGPSSGPCKAKSGRCICSLKSVEEIFLQPATLTGVRYLRPDPPGVLPSQVRALDLGWMVRMKNVESAAARIGSWEVIRPYVWTRMNFGWDYAHNCAFDEVEEEGEVRIRYMRFLSDSQQPSNLMQAVSEEVTFESRVPAMPVKLVLQYRTQAGILEKIELGLKCGDGNCPDLEITNEAPETCDDCDVGDHFDHYYNLANNRTNLKRLHPVRTDGDYRVSRDIGLRRCPKDVPVPTVGSRVICPMVLFDP